VTWIEMYHSQATDEPNSNGQHYSKGSKVFSTHPLGLKTKPQNTGIPGWPRDLARLSPLHRLRRRVLITCDGYDLHYSSPIILAFIAIEKQNFWARPLCAFFWIMRTRRGENSWDWCFCFLLSSLMITGVLEVVSWVICFRDALLSEQGVGTDGQIGGFANGIEL
jgi:hypothetical protein